MSDEGRADGNIGRRVLRWYYQLKYAPFRRERQGDDGRRGAVVLQIDALAYADLRRAIEAGHCPTLAHMLRTEGFEMRRWFCGLPSATPYCQAGIFHGENDGIPAFRFYDKGARQIVTCNAEHGVQYIRDRITSPGALAGGSSYVNLIDGDARRVAFTVATRERLSIFGKLGGWRMVLLVLLHPVRMARMMVQAVLEWLREEWERLVGEMRRRTTHAEGIFPFVRILSNVVIRELQTMAIGLDVYLGVPIIYSTYMQYDELAHHFGPTSRQAMRDLRRTDARIAEIWRMIRLAGGREYDLIVLSDHGMTPAVSYRVRFGETLGTTIQRVLDEQRDGIGRRSAEALASFAEDPEYADVGARILEEIGYATRPESRRRRWLRRARDWVRSRYGLRELVLPEKYRVEAKHDVVVTYSSDLAHVYFARDQRPLGVAEILGDAHRAHLYLSLLAHPGVGLIIIRDGDGVRLRSRAGRARLKGGELILLDGTNPLAIYGTEPELLRAIEELLFQPNCGDLVLFGDYDGYEIVSFDDQVGAHGAAGGEQVRPFLITPAALGLRDATIENARDIHRHVMLRYARPSPDPGEAAAAV
jgi:hypothetical protein